MNFIQAVKSCFSKFATFSGRAPRSEYWWFALFILICIILIPYLDSALGLSFTLEGISLGLGYLTLLFYLSIFVPSLSVAVRRLHDKDKSGWFYWIVLIPIVGPIILLVWFCQRGTVGNNKYGSDPLAK